MLDNRARRLPRPRPVGITFALRRAAHDPQLLLLLATAPRDTFSDTGRQRRRVATGNASATSAWAEDPGTSVRRDLSGEEDRAFWIWAAVETVRHTGIRIEELIELSSSQPDPKHPAHQR